MSAYRRSCPHLAAALVTLFAVGCGGDPDPEPVRLDLPRVVLSGTIPGGSAPSPSAADGDRFLAALLAPDLGKPPAPVALGTDLRPAVRAWDGARFRASLAEGPAPETVVPDGTVLALDVIVLSRDGSPATGTITGDGATPQPISDRWGVARFPMTGPGADTELRLDLGGSTDTIALFANPRACLPAQDQPTVLLITSDTHRADHVSIIDPNSPVRTPHLDALAGEGALFRNCLTSINTTNSSHIALLTGVHPRDTKIVNNHTRLHESASTLAESFRAAGYQTFAALSAFHLFDETSGLGQGFDRMNTTEGLVRDGAKTLEIAEQWVADAEGAPLFMWVHLFDAHTPYDPPADARIALLEDRKSPYDQEFSLGVPEECVPNWLRKDPLRDPVFIRALYAGEVEYLDGMLERFLGLPRLQSASLAFTSDHGEGLGEQSIWWDHETLQPATLHVPLILRGPGAVGGAVSDAPVRQRDIGRTLLNMAGLEDAEFPGRDVRDAIGETPASEPRFAISAHGLSISIEHEGWLLELYLRDSTMGSSAHMRPLGRCYLFHIADDPGAEVDLVVEEFDRAKRLREVLINWVEAAEVTGYNSYNQNVDPSVTARLEELGYSGGYESVLRWWTPELRDPNWTSNPWFVAFQGAGNAEVLEQAIATELANRPSPR